MSLIQRILVVILTTKMATCAINDCTSSTNIVFVLDSSGSLSDNMRRMNNWDFVRRFISSTVSNFDPSVMPGGSGNTAKGLQFALVQFATTARVTFNFNTNRGATEFAAGVLNVENFGGPTNLAAGLLEAEKLLPSQPSSRNTIIVIISDFQANIDRNELFIAQRMKNRDDVKIVTVGIKGNVDEPLMRQISSENRFVLTENYQDLLGHISPLINYMCEIEIVIQPGQRLGQAQPLTESTTCARDIMLVMDASVSIEAWATMKEFVALVAANLGNTAQDTRIGVVTFSDQAKIASGLVPYTPALASTILGATHMQSLTNIADGLRKAQMVLEDQTRHRYAIIFTDGIATVDTGTEMSVAESMRKSGITIVSYGVGTILDQVTLQNLVDVNQRNTHVIINQKFATTMMPQLNSIVSLAACKKDKTPCVAQSADVVLAIDSSGSILDKGPANWVLMREFAVELATQLVKRYPQIRIGALNFGTTAQKIYDITNNHQQLIQAIRNAQNSQSTTNQVEALRLAMALLMAAGGSAANRKKYVIMITDGEQNVGTVKVKTAADELERAGIIRIVVGVTNQVDHVNLDDVASRSNLVFYSETFNTLKSVPLVTNVVEATTNCPGESITDGPNTCSAVDVIFAMDRSASIEATSMGNYKKLKDFISDLARSMQKQYSQVRFGLVAFSGDAEIIAWLKRYNNVETFVDIIQKVPYDINGLTNLAAAIRESRKALGQDAVISPQIVIATDGEATVEKGNEINEAKTARDFGVQLSAIAVSEKNFEDVLLRLTNDKDRVFRSPTFQQVQNIIPSVTQVSCQGGEGGTEGGGAGACAGLPEIVLVLDVSGSVLEGELRSAKDFINTAIETFLRGNSKSRFGLVTFSTNAQTLLELTSDLSNTRTTVNGVQTNMRGRTNIAEGLERGATVLQSARTGSNKILILITDGLANVRPGEETAVATKIKADGISIVPVGISEFGPDYNKLEMIASNGVIKALNFASLNTKINELTQLACGPGAGGSRPPLPPLPPPPTFTPRPVVTTPAPIYNDFPEPGLPANCPGSIVVLVMDSSKRLYPSQADFDLTKNMAISLVRGIAAASPNTKFGVVSFDSTSKVVAGMPPALSLNAVTSAINSMTLGSTQNSLFSNIGNGLFEARNLITRNVNPQNVQSYMILFSDGVSSIGATGSDLAESRVARSLGINMMAVGIGERVTSALNSITMNPSRVYSETDNIINLISKCGSKATNVYLLREENYCPEEIVFVVDSAGNETMEASNRRNVSEFMSSVVKEYSRFYDVRGRFAAVQISDVAELAMTFSKETLRIIHSLSHLKTDHFSRASASIIPQGLDLANELFADNEKTKLVILITDEVADAETTKDILEAVQRLTDRDINFMVVGIAKGPQHDMFYEKIASYSEGVISVSKYDELKNQVNSVINAACRADKVTFRKIDDMILLR